MQTEDWGGPQILGGSSFYILPLPIIIELVLLLLDKVFKMLPLHKDSIANRVCFKTLSRRINRSFMMERCSKMQKITAPSICGKKDSKPYPLDMYQ